jgi:hypothetical protein
MLYASTTKLISVRTFRKRFIKRCVGPIQDLNVPNTLGCLPAPLRRHRHTVQTLLHPLEHVLMLPAADLALVRRRALIFELATTALRCPVAVQRLALLDGPGL